MKLSWISVLILTCCQIAISQQQEKKTMGPEVYDSWNSISNHQISNDGNWVAWEQNPGEGDGKLYLYDVLRKNKLGFERGSGAKISVDNRFFVFRVQAHFDTLQNLKRLKTEEDKLPPDTLMIYDMQSKATTIIPHLKSFQLPEEWPGYLCYQLKDALLLKTDSTTLSTTDTLKLATPSKQENEENGSVLVIRNLEKETEDSVAFVKDYKLAEKSANMVLHSTGKDSVFTEGIYLYDCKTKGRKHLFRGKAKFKSLGISKNAKFAAFLADRDTTEERVRPWDLFLYRQGPDSAKMVASNAADFLPKDWLISEHANIRFSDNEQRLFFGMAPPPILPDTTLLPEEIVDVEVWSYTDKKIYPQQNIQLDEDKKRWHAILLNLQNNQITPLGDKELDRIIFDRHRVKNHVAGYNQTKYYETLSWEGFPAYKDIYSIDVMSGKRKRIAERVKANPELSPDGRYIYWWNQVDTAWFAHHIKTGKTNQISHNKVVPFHDEMNDRPMLPGSYGVMGWFDEDKYVLIYDRYDIWKIDPSNKRKPKRLTKGRKAKDRFRYIRLDNEKLSFRSDEKVLLYVFNEDNMSSGYARLSLKSGKIKRLVNGNFAYNRYPKKAKDADKILFTKENFNLFPDLQLTGLDFKNPVMLSHANPQQSDYKWGTINLFYWETDKGEARRGLIVKPEGFSPDKQYPLLVNFYEKSSHNLHNHRAPYPHRSTINYTYYANQGYVIFNPDVHYKNGYPGESAEESVISGIKALSKEGYIDEQKIGVQGHSWGGYQVAHLLTKTDIFACAESGAPVVNMISAYGGIRWGSGLSRMFQYEQSQSRLGATLWEKPELYFENSPIFNMDKVKTPVLILHNDNDGAVPWYQGIEFFVALRRLGKQAWMLNYNKEPHWPVKRQNRLDFNKRMQAFFDHYLMGKVLPEWMEKGVPAVEKYKQEDHGF